MTWKTFLFFFEQRRSRPLKCGERAHERAPPLSRTTVAERIERNTNETTLHSSTEETQVHKTVAFSKHSSTCWMIIPESCLACVALNIYANDLSVWKVLNGDSRVSTTSWPIIDVGSATNLAKSQAGLKHKAHRGISNRKRKYPNANGCNF